MYYKKISNEKIINKLEIPSGRLNVVIDTDTYNEIDDQFAIAYALRSPDRLNVEAIYAAPFHNMNSSSPCDGMEKSYDEIFRVLDKLDYKYNDNFVFKGSTRYLENLKTPCDSEAVRDLIDRAMKATEPLYVLTIGAITNIASAILIEPKIVEKIVVIWLGGHSFQWHDTFEFNLMQDVLASNVIFDCGAPLILCPCMGVVSNLHISVEELERYIDGQSEIGTYLCSIVKECCKDLYASSRVIWDIATVAYLINSKWVNTKLVPSPIVSDRTKWSFDDTRHLIKYAYHFNKDKIFGDMFKKLSD